MCADGSFHVLFEANEGYAVSVDADFWGNAVGNSCDVFAQFVELVYDFGLGRPVGEVRWKVHDAVM